MSRIYTCADCDGAYCVDCDGGLDSCELCHKGPFCDDCAAEDHGTGVCTHPEDDEAEAEEVGRG